MAIKLDDNRKIYAETMEAHVDVLHARRDLMRRRASEVRDANRKTFHEWLDLMERDEKDIRVLIRNIYDTDHKSWMTMARDIAIKWQDAKQAEAIAASKFLL